MSGMGLGSKQRGQSPKMKYQNDAKNIDRIYDRQREHSNVDDVYDSKYLEAQSQMDSMNIHAQGYSDAVNSFHKPNQPLSTYLKSDGKKSNNKHRASSSNYHVA